MAQAVEFDAIVVGSGITGGWAAKELTERGLKVLMLERGTELEHGAGYTTEFTAPWEMPFRGYGDPKVRSRQTQQPYSEFTSHLFVDDAEEVYETESDFRWIRGYHTGGKSVMWGRQSYRMSEEGFEFNGRDGHGVDWPIRYADLAPWYDHVETFIGVNGTVENLPTMPDGKFQPAMPLNAGELRFAEVIRANYSDRRVVPARMANLTLPIGERGACQHRNQCARGCSFGAYFSTQSSTLPAARATGRLTLKHDSIVEAVEYDPATRRATGVRVVDAGTGQRRVETARIVFVCANAYDSVAILQRSASEAAPQGLGGSSGLLGAYVMDHAWDAGAVGTIPGIETAMYLGRRPSYGTMARFVNVGRQETDFYRGYSFRAAANRLTWTRGTRGPGIGAEFKAALRQPGEWRMDLGASIEMLPNPANRVTINWSRRDAHGLPLTRIDLVYGENERKAARHAEKEAVAMLNLLGGTILESNSELARGGTSIHDMGGACMGKDPRGSVTNARNQLHDAPNVFVTDGAAMCSTGDRNPSLTYMALTARACANAVSMLKEGAI